MLWCIGMAAGLRHQRRRRSVLLLSGLYNIMKIFITRKHRLESVSLVLWVYEYVCAFVGGGA